MQTTRSRLEKRLARLLATTPPLTTRPPDGRTGIDAVYLTEDEQDRLDRYLRE